MNFKLSEEELRDLIAKYEGVIAEIKRAGFAIFNKENLTASNIPDITKKIDEFQEKIKCINEMEMKEKEKEQQFINDQEFNNKMDVKLDRMKDDTEQKRYINSLITKTSNIDDLRSLHKKLHTDRTENQMIYNVAQSNYRFLTKRLKVIERKVSSLEEKQPKVVNNGDEPLDNIEKTDFARMTRTTTEAIMIDDEIKEREENNKKRLIDELGSD